MNTDALNERAAPRAEAPPGAAPSGHPAAPLAGIEVDLHLELQVLSMPLTELTALRPGCVLELPTPAVEATVDLVVNGQVLGRAQLVVVGDRIGARILELAHEL